MWLAPTFERQGDEVSAAGLLGAAAGIRRRTGASVDWQEQEYLEELEARLRAALEETPYAEAFSVGERDPEVVVREVLALSGSHSPPS